MSLTTSYATILKENRWTVQKQLVTLVRSGYSNELDEFLSDRPYARNLLGTLWIDAVTKEHLSLLMVAAIAGEERIVRGILTHSSALEKMVQLRGRVRSAEGDIVESATALWCAFDRAHFNVARTLINEGNANVNQGPRHPLLIDAIIRGRLDIVRFLIDNNYADLNQAQTNDKYTCTSLIVSVIHDQTSIVEFLIGKGAALEWKSPIDGNTALVVAVSMGNLKLVQLLCEAGASLTVRNHATQTPVTLAAEQERFDLLEFIFAYRHDDLIFNDLELAIAAHILTQHSTVNYRSAWVKQCLKYTLIKRRQFEVPKATVEAHSLYDDQQECQTLDELSRIENNDDRVYIEALLIQQRIFRANEHRTVIDLLFDQATRLAEKALFDRCLSLVLHVFHLCQREQCQPSLERYFWIFYTLFRNSKGTVPDHPFWRTFDEIFKSSAPKLNHSHQRDLLHLLDFGFKVRGRIDQDDWLICDLDRLSGHLNTLTGNESDLQ